VGTEETYLLILLQSQHEFNTDLPSYAEGQLHNSPKNLSTRFSPEQFRIWYRDLEFVFSRSIFLQSYVCLIYPNTTDRTFNTYYFLFSDL